MGSNPQPSHYESDVQPTAPRLPLYLIIFLLQFREITDKSHQAINDMIMNSFK